MYCPFCSQWKLRKTSGKNNWSVDQWFSKRADFTCSDRGIQRNCCNACSDGIGEYYHSIDGMGVASSDTLSHRQEPRPSLQPWTFPSEVTEDMFSESWLRLRDMPTEFWNLFHTNVCSYGYEDRTHRWIRQNYHFSGEITPRKVSPLKFLSKLGGVRVRASGIPRSGVDWLDQECGMGYIDPGNAIYSFVLASIWPGLSFSNIGTRGDIVEALLGWSFLSLIMRCQPRTNKSVEFVLDLDRVLWYVWTHRSSFLSY